VAEFRFVYLSGRDAETVAFWSDQVGIDRLARRT